MNGMDLNMEHERKPARSTPEIETLTMKLSDGREEYYTRINCDGRTFDVRRYGNDFRNRADYEHAELCHVLLGEPRPDLMDPKYADKGPVPTPEADPVERLRGIWERDEFVEGPMPLFIASFVSGELATARNETLKEAAHRGYVTCAQTRHVSLGDMVSADIIALQTTDTEEDLEK